MSRYDGITYINLAMRLDRKEKIKEEFKMLCLDERGVDRIEGHFDELNGAKGCVLSHIDALNLAIKKGWNSAVILEDDCQFIDDVERINTYIEDFHAHFGENWDVFFLGTDPILTDKTAHEKYLRVIFSMRAHSYIVNGPYLEKLRDYFIGIHQSMEGDLFYQTAFKKALDRGWVELQRADRWYVGVEMVTYQRMCYSDIEKRVKPKR